MKAWQEFVSGRISPMFLSLSIREALFSASAFVSKEQNMLLLYGRNIPCFRAAWKHHLKNSETSVIREAQQSSTVLKNCQKNLDPFSNVRHLPDCKLCPTIMLSTKDAFNKSCATCLQWGKGTAPHSRGWFHDISDISHSSVLEFSLTEEEMGS